VLFVVVCCRISRARGERKRKREALDLNKKRQILVRDVLSHPFDTRGSVSVLRVQSEKNNARAQPGTAGRIVVQFFFLPFCTFSKGSELPSLGAKTLIFFGIFFFGRVRRKTFERES
jgi:hypothetical protein